VKEHAQRAPEPWVWNGIQLSPARAAQVVKFLHLNKDCFALLIETDLQKPASPLQGFSILVSEAQG